MKGKQRSHLLHDRKFTALLMNNYLQKHTSHGFITHILYLKVRTIIVWVEKTLQNKELMIIEQKNFTAKYLRYFKSPFLGHNSKTVTIAIMDKKGYKSQIQIVLFKQDSNYKNE